jgi:hypothetical protein
MRRVTSRHHVNYLGPRRFQRLGTYGHNPCPKLHVCTNNRSDFLVLHGKERLHAGVIIIVPSVTPVSQRELFSAALAHIGARDLTNTVVEVKNSGTHIKCSEYALPEAGE